MSHHLEIALPSGFGAIPLHRNPDECERQAHELLLSLPQGSIPDLPAAVRGLVSISAALVRSGAMVAGYLTLVDQPASVSAFVVVAVQNLSTEHLQPPVATRDQAVSALISTMRDLPQCKPWEIVHLDTGSAARSTRTVTLEVPGSVTVNGASETLESRGVQYLIPGPTLRNFIALDVSTTHAKHWHRFQHLAHTIANSLTLSPEDPS